jgi:hypothetical protein
LPGRIWQAGWLLATLIGWNVSDRGIEANMRVFPVQQSLELVSKWCVADHDFSLYEV